MRELVLFTWAYFLAHPEFLSLLGTENLHKAAYLKRSKRIRELHSPLVGMISALLERGAKARRIPRRRRSGRALHHHRGARLLLSLQPPHALDHLRPRPRGAEEHRGARAAHRRCRPQLPETVTHAHLPDPRARHAGELLRPARACRDAQARRGAAERGRPRARRQGARRGREGLRDHRVGPPDARPGRVLLRSRRIAAPSCASRSTSATSTSRRRAARACW